eukprot:gene1290-1682_t
MGFLNYELEKVRRPGLANTVIDTVTLAREKHPGARVSLDALCKHYGIDNSRRTLHGALLDSEILADVYLELIGGRQVALALVEADLGAATANLIARHFVLYARRPGYQSQFSPLLQAQTEVDAPFARLIEWMQTHLDEPLDVPALAARAGLSERSFYRKFVEATGKTPAHFVEGLRLDAARTLLEKGLPLKAIAGRVGLRSSARLGQAFERRFGMAPSLFREMHATSV